MNRQTTLALLLVAAAAVVAAAPFLGREPVPLAALWQAADDPMQTAILWRIRIPRAAIGFLAGAALALSGATFQAMFRNPLAEPYTLGVSSGAALGAALAIFFEQQIARADLLGAWRFSAVSLAAFAGAVLVMALIYGLGRARRGFSTPTMLLAGVAVSFFCSSLILLVQYLSDFTQTFRMLRWVMGGLESVVAVGDVFNLLPFTVAGAMILFALSRELNLLVTGEDLAASRGVELHRTKLALFLTASLMVGAVVALCGPIGFVGLMAPHICRLLIGPDHRWLLPASLLFGGAFLVACDALARTALYPTELPVGIITALLGGPFFLWLLWGRGRE